MPNLKMPVVDVVPDGDVLLTLSGLAGTHTQVALRVSGFVLTMTSPVFTALLAALKENAEAPKQILVTEDHGDSMYLLLHIIHLRNNVLPPQIPPEHLHKLALLAQKYQCVVAVGRATLQWFDRLYHSRQNSTFDIFQVIEAAQLLDEPTYFARFTERCLLSQPMGTAITAQGVSGAQSKLVGKSRPELSKGCA